MARRKLSPAAVLAVVFALSASVLAVKYGVPDDGEHPYVGLLVFYDSVGYPIGRCTGTLISPTVLLTAAHCTGTDANRRVQVFFQENVNAVSTYPFSGGVWGSAYAYPDWTGAWILPNTGDVGVVVLDQAQNLGYANLAEVGYLDRLANARGQKSVIFKVVGYGYQSIKPTILAFRERLKAFVQLVNLGNALTDGYNIRTSNSPGKGTGGGGTCIGDSGGALFNDDNEIVAVNSFVGNDNCTAGSFSYRVDTPDAQAWVLSFLN